jgi:putative oxidoreductase
MAMARTFFMSRYEQAALTLLRAGSGLMFMQHGVQKLFGWLGGFGPTGGTVPLVSQLGLAGVLEIVGGFMVAIGLFTRPAAFILSGMMAVAYFQMHAPHGFFPAVNFGEQAALYCFVFFYLSARGGGPYSVDGAMEKRRGAARLDFAR